MDRGHELDELSENIYKLKIYTSIAFGVWASRALSA
jgi:hypothetical protein